jgi:hypothetical protein
MSDDDIKRAASAMGKKGGSAQTELQRKQFSAAREVAYERNRNRPNLLPCLGTPRCKDGHHHSRCPLGQRIKRAEAGAEKKTDAE